MSEPRVTTAGLCKCGHTQDWHSHSGVGGCEHDAECECESFSEGTEALTATLEEIWRLASDPFASEAVALRACLLAAGEALGKGN